MNKAIEAARALLEEMASNNYNWSSNKAILTRSSGRYKVDVMEFLTSKVDALIKQFDQLGAPTSGSSFSTTYEIGISCKICDI